MHEFLFVETRNVKATILLLKYAGVVQLLKHYQERKKSGTPRQIIIQRELFENNL